MLVGRRRLRGGRGNDWCDVPTHVRLIAHVLNLPTQNVRDTALVWSVLERNGLMFSL